VGNDPQRGLWHVLDVFDKLKVLVPHATLHVGYDFDRVFEAMRWQASAAAQMLWECKERMATTEGVTNLGALSRPDVIREQLECQVHVWPSDPPNVGSQIHGLTQMECAAAGAALVLSDIEAFPEVFGEAATLLPVPGTYVPSAERRLDAQDWAEAVAELMLDPDKWAEASKKSRALAEQHTWAKVLDNWETMFVTLANQLQAVAA
jgi:glycosyltransferase involved in cell wall biosynthesis